jgi:predicted neuraminidase
MKRHCMKGRGKENKLMQLAKLSALAFIMVAGFLISCRNEKTDNSLAIKTERDSLTIVVHDFVFGDDRPFLQCHASTVLNTTDGNFLVAWFGGTYEKHDDVGIWLSKGKPGAWSVPVEIAKMRKNPHWNPVLFRSPDGSIILYFKVGSSIDDWETWYKVSTDNGETWTDAKELVAGDKGGRGPVRNKPVVLSDGTWLAPASNERSGVWNAFVDRSEDHGKTWTASSFVSLNRDSIPDEGVIQPALWESSPGNVHMLLRSSAGVICRSDSKDYGRTWSPVYKTDLPNPNSGIDVAKLDDSTLVLAYNPDGKNWGARRPLAVAISNDNGKTWPTSVNLETGSEGDEFSYPSITYIGDTVAVTYTWKRERIAFWILRVD